MPPKVSLALLLANVVGTIIYLLVASYGWAIPQERGWHATTGEPFIWALGVMPVWAVFSLLNLSWGAIVAARRQWRSGRLLLVTACVWVIAVVIDFAHH